VTKTKVVGVVKIGDDEYDFENIKRKTVRAPLIKINLSFLSKCRSNGNPAIDSSEIRITKILNQFHVLSGYDKIVAARASQSSLNSIETETNTPLTLLSIEALLMSPKFLQSTLLPPKVIPSSELAAVTDKLAEHFSSNNKRK